MMQSPSCAERYGQQQDFSMEVTGDSGFVTAGL
jgi:hypothetical protein